MIRIARRGWQGRWIACSIEATTRRTSTLEFPVAFEGTVVVVVVQREIYRVRLRVGRRRKVGCGSVAEHGYGRGGLVVIAVVHSEQEGNGDDDEGLDDVLGESRWSRKECLAYRILF